MLRRLFRRLLSQKSDSVTVKVTPSDTGALFVRLYVNDRLTARMMCVEEPGTAILIGDILHSNEGADYNKGYGSLMMEQLLEYAGENGIAYIHGNLSEVDLEHKDRLHHFYEKFGFLITEYPELEGSYYGKIELYLPKNANTPEL